MGLLNIFKNKSTDNNQVSKQNHFEQRNYLPKDIIDSLRKVENSKECACKNDKEIPLSAKTNNVEKPLIPEAVTNDLRTIEASMEYREKVYNKYYWNFPEKPFISKDRELNTNWLKGQEMFLFADIIPRTRMTRFPDRLLPGHVYMLYWLKKYTNKSIPVYFEYRYGINFEKEKQFLIDNGYLGTNNKPTALGDKAIQEHNNVIEEHILDSGHNREIQNARKRNPSEIPTKDMVDNNLRGMGFEKDGNIIAAINLYEYNVKHHFCGALPYQRLAIIYRKQKDYKNEIRVINSALKIFQPASPDDWFTKRLERSKELQKKQKKN